MKKNVKRNEEKCKKSKCTWRTMSEKKGKKNETKDSNNERCKGKNVNE